MALAVVYTALTVAGIIVGVLLAPHASFAMPYEPLAKEVAYVARYGPSIRWGAFFQLGSAMPLGIFAAVTGSRLRFLGVRGGGDDRVLSWRCCNADADAVSFGRLGTLDS